MDGVINFGNPSKDWGAIVQSLEFGHCDNAVRSLKLTGARVFVGKELFVTSSVYGAGMALDCFEELKMTGLLTPGDRLVGIGSMGSTSDQINLGDVVLPDPCLCAYYGFAGTARHQDATLLASLERSLSRTHGRTLRYRHGTSFAVFDPANDHANYRNTVYHADDILGIDCGEVFICLEFSKQSEIACAVALYCSDSPKVHIGDVGAGDFEQLASGLDLSLNQAAVRTLSGRP